MRAAVLLLLVPILVAAAVADDRSLDLADAPGRVRRLVFRAEAAHRRGEAADAARILADAVEDDGDLDHPLVRHRLGSYLLELGEPARALPHLVHGTELAPRSAPLWATRARAAYESGAHADAGESFARAHALAGRDGDPTLLYYSAVAWLLSDDAPRAVDTLEPLVAAASDTVPQPWVQALVSAADAAGAPHRAGPAAARLVRDHPDRASAWRLASQQAQLAGDLARAALRLQVADWLAPLPPAGVRRLADLQGVAGLPRQAARTYERLWPGRREVARPLAISWLHAHEPDSARIVLTAALADTADAGLWTLLGHAELESGDPAAACRAFGRATDLDPDDAQAWLRRAAACLEAGEEPAARRALDRARRFDATAAEARRLLRSLDD